MDRFRTKGYDNSLFVTISPGVHDDREVFLGVKVLILFKFGLPEGRRVPAAAIGRACLLEPDASEFREGRGNQ